MRVTMGKAKSGEHSSGEQAGVTPWNFRMLGIRLIVRRTWVGMLQDNASGRAAQLAYYFFFSLFPALIAASALIGLVASSVRKFSDQLVAYLGTVIPSSAYQMVWGIFNETTHASSGGKLIIGLAVALWSASSGTVAIQEAFNAVFKVNDDRPYWRARLLAIELTVGAGFLVVMALIVLVSGDMIAAYLTGIFKLPMLLMLASRILAWPIAFCLVAFAFALLHLAAPYKKREHWRWMTPGAAIGILLWLAASAGLRVYLYFFHTYSVTYGSLGAVIALLTWFYISGLALMLGAEIDKVVEDLVTERNRAKAQHREQQSVGDAT
jgi:membrane protein